MIVPNLNVTRSIDEIKSDTWQGPLVLDGKIIQIIKSMKVLGQVMMIQTKNTSRTEFEQ